MYKKNYRNIYILIIMTNPTNVNLAAPRRMPTPPGATPAIEDCQSKSHPIKVLKK